MAFFSVRSVSSSIVGKVNSQSMGNPLGANIRIGRLRCVLSRSGTEKGAACGPPDGRGAAPSRSQPISKRGLDLLRDLRRYPARPQRLILLEELLGAFLAARLIIGHPGDERIHRLVLPGPLVQ